VYNQPVNIIRAYSGDLAGTHFPAQTIAGIHVPAQIIAGMTSFLILRFSGSKKHFKTTTP
jgi:hypothetical protein